MVSTTSPVHHIDKLRGFSNYATWKIEMKACLNRDGLWKAISGSGREHPPSDANELAYDTIVLTITKPQLPLIEHCHADGKAAWETFARFYDRPGRLALRRLMYKFSAQEQGEAISRYLERKLGIAKRLGEAGVALNELDIVDLVLMDLSDEWRSWAEELSENGRYTVEEMKKALLKEEDRRGGRVVEETPVPPPLPPPPTRNGKRPHEPESPSDLKSPATPGGSRRDDLPSPSKKAKTTPGNRGPRKQRTLQPLRSGSSTTTTPTSATAPTVPTSSSPTTTNGHTHPRPFQCLFTFAGCRQLFGSKNEWKRHINHIHLQLWYWRCDFPSCANRKATFNRKDLFGQHLKRMHPNDSQTTAIQERCRKERRKPPETSVCGFCKRSFEGPGSWEAHVDHLAVHYHQGAKPDEWELDEKFVEWALAEDVVKKAGNGTYTLTSTGKDTPLEAF